MPEITKGPELVPMSDETRGHAIHKRRMAFGITSLREFAEATGVARQTIARAERGEPGVTERTYIILEGWLDRFEEETGGPADEDVANEHTVEYRLSGDFGVDLLVKGPVSNMPEMEASVGRLLDRMRSKPE